MPTATSFSTNECELVLFNEVKKAIHARYLPPPPPSLSLSHAHTLKGWDTSLNPTSSNQLILSSSWMTFQQNQLMAEVGKWALHFREGERTSLCLEMSPEAARTRAPGQPGALGRQDSGCHSRDTSQPFSWGLISTTWHHWLLCNCFKWTVSSWITTATLLGFNIRLNYRKSQEV